MKKLILTLVFLMGVSCALKAASDNQPRGAAMTARGEVVGVEWGGLSVATASFSNGAVAPAIAASTACAPCSGVLSDVNFSTGNAFSGDFVDVWDSTSTDLATNSTRIGRFYNATTFSVAGATQTFGSAGPRYPIRFEKGLIFKASSNVYNLITVLFNRD